MAFSNFWEIVLNSRPMFISLAVSNSRNKFPNSPPSMKHSIGSRADLNVTLGKVCIVRNILAAESRSRIANASREPSALRTYPELWATEFLSMAVGSFKREQHAEIFAREG